MEVPVKAKTYLGLYVTFVLIGYLFFVGFVPVYVLHPMYTENVVQLEDGWTVVVHATDSVDVLAFSSNSTYGASLYDEAGNVVLTTQPETVPGNYAVKAVLMPGKYTLEGDETVFEFTGRGFVSLECPERDLLDRRLGVVSWIMLCILSGGLMLSVYFQARREEKEKTARAS